mgnify:CR=1 FL=1
MPAKYQPDYVYLKHVELKKVHLFTLIQLAGFIILWTIKSVKSASIFFPIMVVGTVGIRKMFDYFPKLFSQRELSWLDDVMPHHDRQTLDDHRKGFGKSELSDKLDQSEPSASAAEESAPEENIQTESSSNSS